MSNCGTLLSRLSVCVAIEGLCPVHVCPSHHESIWCLLATLCLRDTAHAQGLIHSTTFITLFSILYILCIRPLDGFVGRLMPGSCYTYGVYFYLFDGANTFCTIAFLGVSLV